MIFVYFFYSIIRFFGEMRTEWMLFPSQLRWAVVRRIEYNKTAAMAQIAAPKAMQRKKQKRNSSASTSKEPEKCEKDRARVKCH